MCINCGECLESCKFGALTLEQEKIVFNEKNCTSCDECLKVCKHNSSPKVSVMSAHEVIDKVSKNIPFINGITVSGGEATLHRDFLVELFLLAKQKNLSTLIDSNGSYDFEGDPELISICDGVLLDVKAWDNEQHIKLVGKPNNIVKNNLEFLAKNAKLEEVRTVVVPNAFDVFETIENVSKIISSHIQKRDIRYKIIKYRSFGVRAEFLSFSPPDDKVIEQLKQKATLLGVKTVTIV